MVLVSSSVLDEFSDRSFCATQREFRVQRAADRRVLRSMAHDSKEPAMNRRNYFHPEVDDEIIYLRPYARHVDLDSVVCRTHGSASILDANRIPAIVGAQLKIYLIRSRTNDCEMFDF